MTLVIPGVDKFLNNITMYRLITGLLVFLSLVSIIFGFTGVIAYSGSSLILSLVILVGVAHLSNFTLAKILKAPANLESSIITGLILFFVLMPGMDRGNYLSLALIAAVAMASKYVFAFRKKHIFNPAAFGVVFGTLVLQYPAMWWVATLPLLPFALIFGFLMARKIRKQAMYFTFLLVAVVTTVIAHGFATPLTDIFVAWPIFFFAGFMLTEPMTSPPNRKLQIIYAVIVGLLFGIPFHLGPLRSAPEVALLIGNIFAFAVSSKTRLMLKLKEKKEVGKDIYHLTFSLPHAFSYQPGQYLEWTLPHKKSDNRGWRRYFTIASSPTEETLAVGIKMSEKKSTFKDHLMTLPIGGVISAGQLSGDFTLPKDPQKKLIFIAGGIGVTPFRSMVKYLGDKGEKRDATLFYSCMTPDDFAYMSLFKEAESTVGLKTVYLISDKSKPYPDFKGYNGYLTPEIIKREVPNYEECMFYLSGPNSMVIAYKKLLKELGIKAANVKSDYFPGF
jgi:ferredoxin-NADP reductase/Na+-translocating ferredoxin:NAD+ oxidoreductase RnfD subunit